MGKSDFASDSGSFLIDLQSGQVLTTWYTYSHLSIFDMVGSLNHQLSFTLTPSGPCQAARELPARNSKRAPKAEQRYASKPLTSPRHAAYIHAATTTHQKQRETPAQPAATYINRSGTMCSAAQTNSCQAKCLQHVDHDVPVVRVMRSRPSCAWLRLSSVSVCQLRSGE
ncbi:hypothetical protein BDU57DRAFT_214496 [Ampelomyces quisqualis]|uniref:Uncharacterized protein n=1 Tax=Ampelomyces quisqualis TaxID=50730 RepID=A0A6A5QPY1_AMPQU|nr:hypothetical protein BDU57DRAFT_214496 [Ampelomyces quisqualis]